MPIMVNGSRFWAQHILKQFALHVMGRRLLLNRVPIRLARLLGVGLQYLDASAGSTRTMGGLARRGAPPARVLSIRRVVFLGDLNGR